MADINLHIVFAGLMVFTPVSNPEPGMWVLLIDAPERIPAERRFPHFPEIRWNCVDPLGEICEEKHPLKHEDLRIDALPDGAVAPQFGDRVISLSELGLGSVRSEFKQPDPHADLEGNVIARFWLSGGTATADISAPCQWRVGRRSRPPGTFSRTIASHVVFEPHDPMTAPITIRRIDHGAGTKDPFEISATGSEFFIWIVNQPSLPDWRRHLRRLDFLPHFSLFHRATGDPRPLDPRVPHNNRGCVKLESLKDPRRELLGTGPIICPGVQDNE